MIDSKQEANRQLSLEFVRGIAAVGVFSCHVAPWIWPLEFKPLALPLRGLAVACVMVFFLLSGVVNRLSLERRPMSRGEFVSRRLRRLYPVYFGACLFSLVVDALVLNTTTFFGLVCLMFVCNGHAIVGLPKGVMCNPAIWSLTDEFIFYLVFLLTMLRSRVAYLVWAGCAVTALSAASFLSFPPFVRSLLLIASFSGIWLLGFWLASVRDKLRVSLPFVAGAASIGLMPMIAEFPRDFLFDLRCFWVGLWITPLFIALMGGLRSSLRPSWPEFALLISGSVFVAGMVVWFAYPPLQVLVFLQVFVLAIFLSPIVLWAYHQAIRWEIVRKGIFGLGRYSYALYLAHMPVGKLSRDLAAPGWPRLIFIVLLTAFVTWALEAHFQRIFLLVWDRALQLLRSTRPPKRSVALLDS